jgi:hypothetical protein
MSETPLFITVDTEGDDLWSRPREITTRNARHLPRFQRLCERYRFKPVYLTNHEMALADEFVEFGRAVLARGAAEIGMHLHAWNSPPLVDLTGDDFRHQPYLIEYPLPVMREKIRRLTRLLEDRFQGAIVSHRAGRWGFDGRYAELLAAEGYRVDCSVTPGVSWRANPGAPNGSGGPDFTNFPVQPYFFEPAAIARPAAGPLLEVPVTVVPSALYRFASPLYRVPLLRRWLNRLAPALGWLSPIQPSLRAPLARHLDAMLALARALRAARPMHVQLVLHSSELMPGGSPHVRDAADLERLYDALETLFEELARWCRGITLRQFHALRAAPPHSACADPCSSPCANAPSAC